MSKKALLINYKYCSGCHSCEIACRNHLQCGLGKWGIKLTEIQPFEAHPGDWNWDYVPVPRSSAISAPSASKRGRSRRASSTASRSAWSMARLRKWRSEPRSSATRPPSS